MLVSMLLPSRTAARLAPTQMSKDHATLRCRRVAEAGEFVDEEFIGQTMEAVTLHPAAS